MAFTLGMTVDMYMHGIYAHAHFGDLDLDAKSQWNGKGKKSALNDLDNWAAISIKLAKMVGHLLHDVDFETVYIYGLTIFLNIDFAK